MADESVTAGSPEQAAVDEPRRPGAATGSSDADSASPSVERSTLAAVPDAAPADRRAPVARWAMSLAEPLISTSRRIVLDADLAAFTAGNPQWTTYWFAGLVSDLVATLPPEDPWRHLSASLDLGALSDGPAGEEDRLSFDNPRGRAAPAGTGAVLPDGRRFGTAEDSADLLMPDIGPPDADIGVVALTEPLDPVAAALAGFATADTELFHAALARLWRRLHADAVDHDGSPGAGGRWLAVVTPVLRRFIHRRRVYTGPEDPFPLVAAFSWMARADRLAAVAGPLSGERGLAAEGALRAGAYSDLRL